MKNVAKENLFVFILKYASIRNLSLQFKDMINKQLFGFYFYRTFVR
jgi:hypothetical protein